jgi:hypothetical protein
MYASPGTDKYTRSRLWNDFSKQNWETLVEEKFNEFIQQNASFLFESRYVMQQNRLKYKLKWKLFNLFECLLNKGYELIDIEKEIHVENFIQTISLTGKADMVWKNQHHEYLIIDLKTGSKTELKKELEENKSWQLLIYSHFGHAGAGEIIAKAAYFLSSNGKFMLGQSLQIANEILVPVDKNKPLYNSIEHLNHYKRALTIRLEQIEAGQIDFRIDAGFNKALDKAENNPFLKQSEEETDFVLEKEPYKYDKYTFILPDAYRYV